MKRLFKILLSLILSFLLINSFCFFYYNPLHGSELNPYRVEPNTKGLNAVEGYGILYADKNGFSNLNKPLAEKDYILVMGSSQSKADQVFIKDRYSGILNDLYGDEKNLHVYNLAFNGGDFCDIVKNFRELVTEFPYSAKIIIEIADGQIGLSEEEYRDAFDQVDYNSCIKGEQLSEHDLSGNLKLQIKKYFPLVLLLYNQISQTGLFDNKSDNPEMTDVRNGGGKAVTAKQTELIDMYSSLLKLIRSQYQGELIILYHPEFVLDDRNEMIMTKSGVFTAFEKACEISDITLLDVSEEFQAAFTHESIIPYGFCNTYPGTGHLNKEGHKMIADKLIRYLSRER